MPDARFRIGELSKRIGVSPESLRAWEARYRVLSPERTVGGLRLYSERDERRLRLMARHIAEGFPASEAARLARLRDVLPVAARRGSVSDGREMLERSFDALAEDHAQAALDRVVGALTLPSVLSEVILPFPHRLGEQWSAGQVTVAQEHFASNVVGVAYGPWLEAGAAGWGPTRSWPALQESNTISASWASASRFENMAGESPISGLTLPFAISRSGTSGSHRALLC